MNLHETCQKMEGLCPIMNFKSSLNLPHKKVLINYNILHYFIFFSKIHMVILAKKKYNIILIVAIKPKQ